jgi:membrane fusion protein, multidrug efflux system
MAQDDELRNQNKTESKMDQQQDSNDEDIIDVPIYKRKRLIIPLLILLLGAAVGGYYWYMNIQNFIYTDDAYVDANNSSISSKMLGRIVYLGANEGDTVKAGQLLVKLDDSDLKAQETSVKTALELAEKSIMLGEVNVDRADNDFKRGEIQYKDGIITEEQFDHLKQTLAASRAQYAIERGKISSAKSQIGVIKSQLNNTSIYSPMDGVIAKRWVLSGDVIQPAQPVFSIFDLKHLWITANMEETKVSNLRLGDAVVIDVDAYPKIKYYGKVYEIGNFTVSQFSLIPANNASGNFTKVTQRIPVKISVVSHDTSGNTQLILRPGMSVEVTVKIK